MITIDEAARILNISQDYARKVLQRLAHDRWLASLIPGKYELIPAERGEYAFPDTSPLFIGSHLVVPYYFSYATADYSTFAFFSSPIYGGKPIDCTGEYRGETISKCLFLGEKWSKTQFWRKYSRLLSRLDHPGLTNRLYC